MKLIDMFTSIEKQFQKYQILFTILVMYQALFGGLSVSNKPVILRQLSDRTWFKYLTLFCIAFTATRDIEISIASMFVFVFILHLLRNPREREDVSLDNLI